MKIRLRTALARWSRPGPILLSMIGLGLILAFRTAQTAPPEPPSTGDLTPVAADPGALVEALILEAARREETVLAFVIYRLRVDSISFSEDGSWAIATLSFLDPKTLDPVPTEPGLALAHRVGTTWEVALQADALWFEFLEQLPSDLLSAQAKSSWIDRYQLQVQTLPGGPLTGYWLPWAAGQAKYLTRSIAHGIGSSMHYAFDFAEPGFPSDMFSIYASRAGTVRYAVWSYPNGYYDGDCNHSNYLVIEDTTTNPVTYALYLHLAQDSIPPALRTVGAPVLRGQFIGMADDTGCSTGNHLHFQVHTNPDSYWGSSVDVTFEDVPINGGRPRTPEEASQFPEHGAQGQFLYTSGNTVVGDLTPATGAITAPTLASVAEAAWLPISGWVSDSGSGISQYQIVANYGLGWQQVGSMLNQPNFNISWNWCDPAVPDGPLSLALNIWDRDGNLASLVGLTHITKRFECAPRPPACVPGTGQIALFAEPAFAGACQLLPIGQYSDPSAFGEIGDDNVESIQLGPNVRATFYADPSFLGRSETLASSDRNLADNVVGPNQLSSVRVESSSTLPSIPQQIWPPAGHTTSDLTSLSLAWRDAGGAIDYQFELSGPETLLSDWQKEMSVSLGSLATGSYSWRIRARNAAGTGGWTAPRSIQIQPVTPPSGLVLTAPLSADFETEPSDWTAEGLWHWSNDPARAHSGTGSWWYGLSADATYETGDANRGSLTSPPIDIPGPGYALRFWYRYETEGPTGHWDQRWLQIASGSGPFVNLLQLSDDQPNTWLQSPSIDLTAFAGQSVRLRFHFETIDSQRNGYEGWLLDDLELSTPAAANCSDSLESNDRPAAATVISLGTLVTAQICPAGDIDYYVFTGNRGDRVAVDLDAQSLGSQLDTYLFLLDEDGASVLASNDDEIAFQKTDSHLGYLLPRDGSYYLKIRAWDHPGAGSAGHNYQLRLLRDTTRPIVNAFYPTTGSFITTGSSSITLEAQDGESGISHVEFLWHDGDWSSGGWILLGDDWNQEDGWSATLDTNALPDQSGLAVYAKVYDWAGNVTGQGAWEMMLDRTPPATSLASLAPTMQSTAFRLTWDASDNVSGIAWFDLETMPDLEGWQLIGSEIPGQERQQWFIGEPNRIYSFRIRGVDLAGNAENFPGAAEALTYIQGCSAPDGWESMEDDGISTSVVLSPDGIAQIHNFCEVQDQDWIVLNAEQGRHYRINALPLDPSAAVRIRVIETDGLTELADSGNVGFGKMSRVSWIAPSSNKYYLRLEHPDGRVAGDAVNYAVWVLPDYGIYLPLAEQ